MYIWHIRVIACMCERKRESSLRRYYHYYNAYVIDQFVDASWSRIEGSNPVIVWITDGWARSYNVNSGEVAIYDSLSLSLWHTNTHFIIILIMWKIDKIYNFMCTQSPSLCVKRLHIRYKYTEKKKHFNKLECCAIVIVGQKSEKIHIAWEDLADKSTLIYCCIWHISFIKIPNTSVSVWVPVLEESYHRPSN